ncbi:helix-turn-helix domain-containing protein [Bacillus cereus]|uniref:helix-turn-helix domain-containing protein n=1 Tax=Bacillus cereus group TaxID=86661 RepID=UPI003CEFD893
MRNTLCIGYGGKLKDIRKRLDLTLRDVEDFTGISVWCIENAEKSKAQPSNYFIGTMACLFCMEKEILQGMIWCEEPSLCSHDIF